MENPQIASQSPRWSKNTKLIVSLTVIVILGAVVIRFRGLLGPVLLSFVVAYLVHPIICFISRKTHLSWKLTVSLAYLVFVAILITLLTLGGLEIVQQVQNLIGTIQNNVDKLPEYIEQVSKWKFTLGTFELDFAGFDWELIGNQVLAYVEPALGEVGSVVGSVATSAVTTIGWILFITIVSYFFLFESGSLRDNIVQINIPLYAEDVRRMGTELGKIWNAFLRGQAILFLLTSMVYAIFLGILGVRYALLLALITGFANFIPYVGPAINWAVLGLVTYFQDANMFGLSPFAYMAVVVIGAILIDQVFNNLINPRIMANALKVHPAFVLIAALAAANLIGVVGVIIAAPILATVTLAGRYIVRKMLDREPWPAEDENSATPSLVPAWLNRLFKRGKVGSEPARKKVKKTKTRPAK